ncbi:MAG TPA: hypothetical protein VHX52_13065 [Steroidobacteraceae bacterium]|jgi:hypothetical protein|nr:hypothetical protein [Steroidobacteraceae bacterium]
MISTRRDVLKSGAAAVAAVAAASLPPTAAATATLRFHKVAYDGRFREATLFAERARGLGANVHDIEGDITGLWYDHLYQYWKRVPAPVAGITRFNSLLALQMMASVEGLRVVFRAHHPPDRGPAGHAPTHEIFGPFAALAAAPTLQGPAERWAPAAAAIVMRWHADWTAIDRRHSTILDAEARGLASDTLISWILAPVRPRAV